MPGAWSFEYDQDMKLMHVASARTAPFLSSYGCCGCGRPASHCAAGWMRTHINITPIHAKPFAISRSCRADPRRTDEESQPSPLYYSKMSTSGQGIMHHASRQNYTR